MKCKFNRIGLLAIIVIGALSLICCETLDNLLAEIIPPKKDTIHDTENWDIATLDTARNVDYLSDIEKDVILEMNKARSDPKKYAELYIVPFFKKIQQ